jgi:2-(1,2-epoxy-1,2-dihydrophenyl)acetyl-CoA isomerase
MPAEVLFQTRSAILIVTFNRPDKGNALNTSMAKALSEKLKAVSEDRSLRAILLRGAGDTFMDGHDMSGFTGGTNDVQEQIFQRVQFFFTSIRELLGMEKPVISAIDGRVSGAGFSFMLASDLVIATKRSVFSTGYTKHAMIPDGGATFFLPRKVGIARANELLLLGEELDAEEAEKWRLVNKVVDDDALEAESMALAEKIAKGPTRVLGATKRLINMAFEQDLRTQLSLEATTWNAVAKTFDFREGMSAYTAKREPKYTGA